MDGHKTNGLLGDVVGRSDRRVADEPKVALEVLIETLRQVGSMLGLGLLERRIPNDRAPTTSRQYVLMLPTDI